MHTASVLCSMPLRAPVHLAPRSIVARSARSFQTSAALREQKPIARTAPPPPPPQRGHKDQLPVVPLVAIFFLGSAAFYYLLKTREGSGASHYVLPDRAPPKEQWPRTSKE